MLHKLRQRAGDESGFTLIELLVVILIIGILAAIALPSFLGQRTKAQDTEAKTAARSAQTAMETYYTDRQDYAGADEAALKAIEPTLAQAPGAFTSVPTAAAGTPAKSQGYKVSVTAITGNRFDVTKTATTGLITRECTVAKVGGGCPGAVGATGTW